MLAFAQLNASAALDDKRPAAQSKAEATPPAGQPTDVAGVMALVEAEFWKMRAQMLIYHQEKVAALDRLYETLYGEASFETWPGPAAHSESAEEIAREGRPEAS